MVSKVNRSDIKYTVERELWGRVLVGVSSAFAIKFSIGLP